jgi:hypothetical protein
MSKISISKNPKELLNLGGRVYKKHQEDDTASVLVGLEWDSVGPEIQSGIDLHDKVKGMERELESLYEKRDAIVEKVKDQVFRSRDILKGIHRKDLRRLGDWGFDVDN